MAIRILAFAASLRKESFNKHLIRLAADMARDAGAEVDLADFAEFDMPLYNGDDDATTGRPEGALELIRRIEAADGIIISSPEYNYSVPGTLKNAIDWVSRHKPMPLRGRSGLLLSASPSMVGGIRGLWQLRIPLEGLGVILHPDMFALALASQAFDEEGKLKDEAMEKRLRGTVDHYIRMAESVAPLRS